MQVRLRYLFSQYLDNKCSRKELEELFSYIRKAEYDESLRQLIREVYGTLNKVAAPVTHVDENGQLIFDETAWTAMTSPVPPKRKTGPLLVLTVAAVTIAVVAGVWMRSVPGLTKRSSMSSLTRKTTDRSESKYLLLQDSTRVWLNAASSLEFPDQFDEEKREVYLTGEAYFDVVHADKIPFIIHTGDVSTTVLGTAFNIKAYPGQKNIVVSVSRGKVNILRKNKLLATLVKGQQVMIGETGNGIVEKEVESEGIAAWQQGRMHYSDEKFSDIIADMERIYNVVIRVENDQLGHQLVSTSFRKEIGIEQALNVLCKLTDTDLTKKDNVFIIK